MHTSLLAVGTTTAFLQAIKIQIGGKLKSEKPRDFDWFGGEILDVGNKAIVVLLRRTGKPEIIWYSEILEYKLNFGFEFEK